MLRILCEAFEYLPERISSPIPSLHGFGENVGLEPCPRVDTSMAIGPYFEVRDTLALPMISTYT